MVFFDRFYREVFGVDAATLSENVEAQRPKMKPEYGQLFDEILHDCAETVRKDPSDFDALVRGITVYMIVIEGTLALTGARFMLRTMKDNGWLPGFQQGFTAVNRDESRHVGFGVKFLADAIKADRATRETIQATLEETLPVGTLALAPPYADDPFDFVTPVRLRLAGDLRVRDALAVEEARRDGHGARWPSSRLSRSPRAAPAARRRARASGCSRPGFEVLKQEGYAGLTTAKVAARSGQNKALISYHFGSKQGLVAAVGREVRDSITDEVLGGIGRAARRSRGWCAACSTACGG